MADGSLCKHPEVCFEQHGYYLRCFVCGQVWQAIRPTGIKGKYEPGLRAGASVHIPEQSPRRPTS